ncbi:MAG TPA: CoA transferase [Hellea balneolensis]|uniref:CoA transferase n=1 Tax=Hellea balneolensis TaxID=287478 RepID=A0A7V5U0W1_9PROT|nr:CoA transferase [Hellea balneolensis]
MSAPEQKGPLDGILVVEFCSVVLGPLACQILGDLGADVIKVEPPFGDTNRRLGPYKTHKDMAALYLGCNRNKKSIVLDLKSKRGHEAALKLCARADVIVHNFRPSAMKRLGLDYETLKTANPSVIYCATYGYSKRGPYGDMGALDDSIQAASGLADLMGMASAHLGHPEPRYLPTVVGDKTTGHQVAQAVLAALFHRERTGEGQEIEVPMFETMVAFNMVEHLWGQTFEPPLGQAGYTRLLAETRKPYPTKDGYLAVLPYWNNHWGTFCEVAGVEHLKDDPRFVDMQARTKNINATCDEIGKVLATKTTAEWLKIFAKTNVPHMVMNRLDEVRDDPHLVESGFWHILEHPTEGKLRMPGPPVHFSKTPASIRRLPPRMGEHSREILQELGYSQDDISTMIETGDTREPS